MSEAVKRKGGPDGNRDNRGNKRSKVCISFPHAVMWTFQVGLHDFGVCCASRVLDGVDVDGQVHELTCNIQGGSGGKWQTPHQKQKSAQRGGGKIEPGDVGIWATCAKGKEGAATQELKTIFDEVGPTC